jgi:hypothetical protein
MTGYIYFKVTSNIHWKEDPISHLFPGCAEPLFGGNSSGNMNEMTASFFNI